jgi:hypothetical protein
MKKTLLITAAVAALLMLALGGWSVQAVRRLPNPARKDLS